LISIITIVIINSINDASGLPVSYVEENLNCPLQLRELQLVDYIIGAIIGILLLLLSYPFVVSGVDLHHHGIVLAPAYSVNHGAVLFRDVFAQYNALTTYLHVFAFRLFGETLWSLQFFTLCCHGLSASLLFLVTRRFFTMLISVFVVFIWGSSAYFFFRVAWPWSSAYCLLFTLIGLFFLLSKSSGPVNFWMTFFGGVAISLAFWTRQSVGLLAFICVLAALLLVLILEWRASRRALLAIIAFIFGLLFPCALLLLHLFYTGALVDFYKQIIELAIQFGNEAGDGYNLFTIVVALFPLQLKLNLFLLTYALAVITIVFIFLFKRCRGTRKYKICRFGLIAFFILFFTSYLILIKKLVPADDDPIFPGAVAIFSLLFTTMTGFFSLNTRLSPDIRRSFIIIAALAISSWSQYYPWNDPVHTFYSMPIMLLATTLFLSIFASRISFAYGKTMLPIAVIFFLWLPGMIPRGIAGFHKLVQFRSLRSINNPAIFQGTFESKGRSTAIENFAHLIEETAHKLNISTLHLIGSDAGVLMFLSHNRFPKLYVNWSHIKGSYPDLHTKQISEIKITHPLVIVNGGSYYESKSIAKELGYTVLYNEPTLESVLLIPEASLLKDNEVVK